MQPTGAARLVRSNTFDDSIYSRGIDSSNDGDEPFQFLQLRKAKTFITSRSLPPSVSTNNSKRFEYSDVLFRRHFTKNLGQIKRDNSYSSLLQKGIIRRDSISKVDEESDTESNCIEPKRNEAIVVVDTFSTGAAIADILYRKGYDVIRVLSENISEDLLSMVLDGLIVEYIHTIVQQSSAKSEDPVTDIVNQLRSLNIPILAILPGAETGVELADQLSERMGLLSNGTELSEARRNKYFMGERVRACGIRAVKQLRATTWSEIENYITEWKPQPFKVIVKPVDSAGSDDVTLCFSMEEVQKAYGNIIGKVNGLGLMNNNVLVQEYLEGVEYIIDMVSRDGVHKTAGIYEYDRRAVNGAHFVCFGQRLLTADEPRCRELIEYQKKVITALGIKHGSTHGEVKWFNGEPVLVEVGSRCQGAEGSWIPIANKVYGYNQAQMALDAYLNPVEFSKYPEAPLKRYGYGSLKWLVNTKVEGILDRVSDEGNKTLTTLSSYQGHQYFVAPGDKLKKTRDCFTWAGYVKYFHREEHIMNLDYEKTCELEKDSLFIVREANPIAVDKQCVAIVDPFSTGAMLAYFLCKNGYDVIAVYSKKLEQLANLQNLVPQGLEMTFKGVVAYKDDINEMVAAISSVTNNMVALIAGAETGVELADQLSERMGLLSNGTELSEARRNKYFMGERVRACGIRAVKQLRATTWSEIENYITEWKPQPFKVIVKPVDSAGSDDVTLCFSMEEVQKAYGNIIGKVNGLGSSNVCVLVQEYLEGQEYVIDMVSRDGVHYCAAIWAYDRRAVNGAHFVCFGQRLLTADEPRCRELIEYQKKVITALGIKHGPTHGEVKWFNGEPVLVEVGSRCHGAEGSWIDVADKVYGYNQAHMALDAYLNPVEFSKYPEAPLKRYGYGRVLFIIVSVEGWVKEISADCLAELISLPSYKYHEIFHTIGKQIYKTKDCFGFGGLVKLYNTNLDVLVSDYEKIREMESDLFIC